MASSGVKRIAIVFIGFTFLTACEEGAGFNPFEKSDAVATEGGEEVVVQGASVIERDVESPEVFQQTDDGLWDGRPSLGGVWVAHPDVIDPERVIIRNEANGKFVIGALFRRERENPGPRFQVSSDAANALAMLAGAPNKLNVTALRREEVPVAPEVSAPTVDTLEAPDAIQETTLTAAPTPPKDPVAAIAASAIEEATSGASSAAAATTAAAQSVPSAGAPLKAPARQVSSLDKPFLQIGIFSVEANAKRTSDMMLNAGVRPVISKSSANGKDYWRVVVGPAANKSERSAMLKKVKGLGFNDAYAVTK